MSKFLESIETLEAQFVELGIVPERSGAQTLTVPCDGSTTKFTFTFADELTRGVVAFDRARLINVRVSWQERQTAKLVKHPDTDEEYLATHQPVVDATFVVRGRVRVLDDEDNEHQLPLEKLVWPRMASEQGADQDENGYTLYVYGQHQGATIASIRALRDQLTAHGWQARVAPEGFERKRLDADPVTGETGYDLQTRGTAREQFMLSNGAIPVTSLSIRETYWVPTLEDGSEGEPRGFRNFAEALISNFERYTENWPLATTTEQKRVVSRSLFSVTGARTFVDDGGNLVTFRDTAGVPEWKMLVGPGMKQADREEITVSLWPSAANGNEDDESTPVAIADEEPF